MPIPTGPAYRLMVMIAHGHRPRSGEGPSEGVAKEMVDKTPPAARSRFMREPYQSRRERMGKGKGA